MSPMCYVRNKKESPATRSARVGSAFVRTTRVTYSSASPRPVHAGALDERAHMVPPGAHLGAPRRKFLLATTYNSRAQRLEYLQLVILPEQLVTSPLRVGCVLLSTRLHVTLNVLLYTMLRLPKIQ